MTSKEVMVSGGGTYKYPAYFKKAGLPKEICPYGLCLVITEAAFTLEVVATAHLFY